MSWAGIKKAINRAGAQVKMKTGKIEETFDPEYELEEKRFRAMEDASEKLQKELKDYLRLLQLITDAQFNVGDALNSFYATNENEEGNEHRYMSQQFFEVVKTINGTSVGELEGPFNLTVLTPVARFNSYYPSINDAIKKCSHKKLDYDSMKTKVNKLMEKSDPEQQQEPKLDQYQRQFSQCENDFISINNQLKKELPQLIDLRIPYLDPSFEAFVKLQLRFFNENFNYFDNLQKKLDAKTREDYISGTLEQRIDDNIAKISKLSEALR